MLKNQYIQYIKNKCFVMCLMMSAFVVISGQLFGMNHDIYNDQEWDVIIQDLFSCDNELENKYSLTRAAALGYIARNNFHKKLKKLNFLEKREQLQQLLPNSTIDYKIDFKQLTPPDTLNCCEITARAKHAVERAVRRYHANGTPITLDILAPRTHGCKQCWDYNCWIVLYFTQYHRSVLKDLIDHGGLQIEQFNDSALFDSGRLEVCLKNYRKFFCWDYLQSINNNITNLNQAIEHHNSVMSVLEGNYGSINDWLLAAEISIYVGLGAWKNFEEEDFGSLEEAMIWYFSKMGLLTHYNQHLRYATGYNIKLNTKLFNNYLESYQKDALNFFYRRIGNGVGNDKINLEYLIACADIFEHKEILNLFIDIKDWQACRKNMYKSKDHDMFDLRILYKN